MHYVIVGGGSAGWMAAAALAHALKGAHRLTPDRVGGDRHRRRRRGDDSAVALLQSGAGHQRAGVRARHAGHLQAGHPVSSLGPCRSSLLPSVRRVRRQRRWHLVSSILAEAEAHGHRVSAQRLFAGGDRGCAMPVPAAVPRHAQGHASACVCIPFRCRALCAISARLRGTAWCRAPGRSRSCTSIATVKAA